MLAKITENVYECQYTRALWDITKYLDPFQVIDYSLVIHSWELLCQYQPAHAARSYRTYRPDMRRERQVATEIM